MSVYTASPIRYPDVGAPALMTRRAWWLVVLNFLIPGSTQVLAGNRKLGRFGLGATLVMWLLAALVGVAYSLWRTATLSIVTNSFALTAAQALLAGYAVLWLVLTIDTLRLVRLIRARPNSRFWIAAFTVILLVASVGTATAGAYYAGVARGTLNSIFGGGAASVPPVDGRYNILLLGGDAGPDRDGLRPDSLSVVSIDADSGRVTMIGLPRDMRKVPFSEGSPMGELYPDGFRKCDVSACKLNAVYTEAELRHQDLYPNAKDTGSTPGIEATKEAAEGVTGLTIQYYALIDMQGFADLIDALGGVEINVHKRLPIGGDEQLVGVVEWIEPGEQTLDGYHAQWYARSRHSTSDFDRMVRQRELQTAILQQFTPANVLTKFQAIAQAGTQVVKTDVPQDMLGYFTNLAMKSKEQPVSSVELTPANGVDQDDPDFSAIRELVRADLYPPTPTETPAG
ncbi:LCP family protein required for cell wall assembly [Okibacterium sp. HSC-33S16]|uniref:LCP family protein n=1 Tax=Okibacterium sp. HSC-33S16 TaxID=2910965 RepID=UPI00209E6B30|nr:LCP family protein [Okibacterium sp. HSC-33S16]MCP2031660.1 LCP family protein required for cell wall assembly [Okibacterium sp. HSC-33S16]